jgi:hypothetical protein
MDETKQLFYLRALLYLHTTAVNGLLERPLVEFLRDHPLESPALDPGMVRRLLDGLPADHTRGEVTRVRVYLLDRDDVLTYGFPFELGAPRLT